MENATELGGKPRVITVFSTNGGTGKTTIAALLAWNLSSRGQSVLVIDLDNQSSISRLFEVERPSSTIADIFPKEDGAPAKTLSEIVVSTSCENVWIAPSDRSLYDLNATTTLRDAIEGLERSFDCIIIDCAPVMRGLSAGAIRAIEAGSEGSTVVVPTRATADGMVAALLDLKMTRPNHPDDFFSLAESLRFVEETLGSIEGELPMTPYKIVTNNAEPSWGSGRMCTRIPHKVELRGLAFAKPKSIDYAALSEILG